MLDGISTRRREQNDPEGETFFSPWEVEFKHTQTRPSRRAEELQIVDELKEESVPGYLLQRLEEFLKSHGRYCPEFVYEVDKRRYSDYQEVVKVEMYLLKVYKRLKNQYYRSVPAVLHDLQLIKQNALLYNDQDSLIARQATLLVSYLNLLLASEVPPPRNRETDKLLRQITHMGLGEREVLFDSDPESQDSPAKPKRRELSQDFPQPAPRAKKPNRSQEPLEPRNLRHRSKQSCESSDLEESCSRQAPKLLASRAERLAKRKQLASPQVAGRPHISGRRPA